MTPSLAQALDLYRAALPFGQVMEFPLTALDRLGVPVQALTLFPSEEPDPTGKPRPLWQFCEGIGYGETDPAALVGAYGELTEEVCSSARLTRLERFVGSYRELADHHGTGGVLDPISLCLEAGSPYTPDTPLEWVHVRHGSTGEPVLIPSEFVACSGMDTPPGEGITRLVTPITNGHGAGTTLEMAQSHGLLELLQRDGNSVRYRALADRTALDLATVTDPACRTLLDRYDAAGIEMVVKVAATDFGMVNLYVVGYDRAQTADTLPVMAAACGEAVHPVAEVALRKALLEFASSRARLALFHGPLDRVRQVTPPGYLEAYKKMVNPADEEPRGLAGMRHWLTLDLAGMRRVLAPVFQVEKQISFADLPSSADPALATDKSTLLRHVTARLSAAGMDVFYADLSTPGTGIHAVKMIVPGLEVETMSYHRIGERNLRRLLDRQAADGRFPVLAGLGDPPPGTAPIPLTAAARQRLGADAWLDTVKLDAVMAKLYVLYREPSRHVTAFSA